MTEFERIYSKYFRDVYSFVLSLSRNEKIAEEITQETFFKALKSIDNFNGHCKINVWLCQIAKNTYFTYLNKQKRFDTKDITEQASESSIEEMLLNKEKTFLVHKVLHALDEPYKEVFTLRVFGELSFKQISQLFEKTESWARVTFYRAKHKIQDLLREEQ
ncbi:MULTISPECIES: RNA polymerase sigma factor [Bacillus cereus group]|uniref:RNA polymerase sigma factor n=1 Tax=Bacillus cereus group TaxID=86661 RepID=UPI001C01E1CD|nr:MULTISPECIES: RNA polymerase sigma factor [Bacillus cereus group]QWG36496.1 RNA polymerase sigma factor [Bacillus mycoides]QWG47908.1 RNA polymerase sigma factor [Bacillus mycoides]QWH15045.1 RNA polymerase sigma factor [Bacillus mycoides]WJE23370.1 RNA polymerase sigma factor [Bacillus cereus]